MMKAMVRAANFMLKKFLNYLVSYKVSEYFLMIVANLNFRNITCLVRIPTNFLKKFPRSIWARGEASALGFLVWAANMAAWCWAITSSLSLSSLASLQIVIQSFSDLRNQGEE